MGTLQLTDDILPIIKRVARQSASDFSDADIEGFANDVMVEFIRLSKCTRSELTFTLTANNPEVDLTDSAFSNFLISRYIKAEIAFSDQGAWSDASVSYAVNDLVTNDSKFYECTEAHTSSASNEPGTTDGATYWTETRWKRGTPVTRMDYNDIRDLMETGSAHRASNMAYNATWGYYPSEEGTPYGGMTSPGRPQAIGFLSQDKAYVYPVPDVAYPLLFVYHAPLAPSSAWTYGTGQNITFNIPDEYMRSAIPNGVAAYLTNPENPTSTFYWQRFLVVVDEAQGDQRYAGNISYRNPGVYA